MSWACIIVDDKKGIERERAVVAKQIEKWEDSQGGK